MKKIYVASFLFLLICINLSACSSNVNNEEKGAPDSVVLSNEAYIDFVERYSLLDYTIYHDVDTTSHIDTLTLVMNGETGYATIRSTQQYIYQYNRSDDIWVLIEEGASNSYTSLNYEAFVSSSPWSGVCNPTRWTNDEFNYTIDIKSIDLSNWTVTLTYSIDFHSDNLTDIAQDTPITVPYPNMDSFYISISSPNNHKIGDELEIFFTKSGIVVDGVE